MAKPRSTEGVGPGRRPGRVAAQSFAAGKAAAPQPPMNNAMAQRGRQGAPVTITANNVATVAASAVPGDLPADSVEEAKMSFSKLQPEQLYKYISAHQLAPRRGPAMSEIPLSELASIAARHFRQQDITERDAITWFLYAAHNLDREFKLRPSESLGGTSHDHDAGYSGHSGYSGY